MEEAQHYTSNHRPGVPNCIGKWKSNQASRVWKCLHVRRLASQLPKAFSLQFGVSARNVSTLVLLTDIAVRVPQVPTLAQKDLVFEAPKLHFLSIWENTFFKNIAQQTDPHSSSQGGIFVPPVPPLAETLQLYSF
jgi:hypothetical protein